MRNFNNNNSGRSQDRRRSGGRDFGRPRRDSQYSGGRSQMHDAVCSDCNNSCQVPFMPSSGKPIYCSDCFERRGNSRGNSGSDSRRPRPSNFSSNPPKNYDKQFKTINKKLDLILKTLAPKEEVKNEQATAEINETPELTADDLVATVEVADK